MRIREVLDKSGKVLQQPVVVQPQAVRRQQRIAAVVQQLIAKDQKQLPPSEDEVRAAVDYYERLQQVADKNYQTAQRQRKLTPDELAAGRARR